MEINQKLVFLLNDNCKDDIFIFIIVFLFKIMVIIPTNLCAIISSIRMFLKI